MLQLIKVLNVQVSDTREDAQRTNDGAINCIDWL